MKPPKIGNILQSASDNYVHVFLFITNAGKY